MEKIVKSAEEWRTQLNEQEFHVCRMHGTEPAFTGEYWDTKTEGVYHCRCCGTPLFESEAKFDSGTGWPSFWKPVSKDAVEFTVDNSHGMVRTEVHCAKCDCHLGHVFPDGPAPTHERYCVNSISIRLEED